MKMHHDVVADERRRVGEIARRRRHGRDARRPARPARSRSPSPTTAATAARSPVAPVAARRRRPRPTWPRCSSGTRLGLDEARPDAVARGAAAAGARRGRTSPTSSTRGRSSSTDRRHRRPAAAARARRPDRQHAGRRPDRRHRHGQRRPVRAASSARASPCPTTTPSSPAPRALQNHRKKDRLFELAERLRLPIVFFTEGGGGRPGDTDGIGPVGPRLPGVPVLRRAVRARPARRRQRRLLLRRQRRRSSAAATS